MIEETYEELIHREVDGVATQEESARLREYLASSPELRSLRDDLNNLSRLLQTVGDVEPPAELKNEIMRGIYQRKHATAGSEVRSQKPSESWLEAATLAFRKRFSLGTAYTFATGVAVGALLFLVLGPGLSSVRMDNSSLPGMMLPIEKLEDLEAIDEHALELEGIRGAVQTKRLSGLVLTEIDLNSNQPIDIVLEFDSQAISPLGFEQSRRGSPGNVSLGAEQIRIEHHGETRYLLVLGQESATEAQLHMSVYSDSGKLLLEKSLETSPGEI